MGRQKNTSGPALTRLGTFQNAQPAPPAAPPPPPPAAPPPPPPSSSTAPVLARFIICDKSFVENRQGRFPGAPRPQQAVSHTLIPLALSIASQEGQVKHVQRDLSVSSRPDAEVQPPQTTTPNAPALPSVEQPGAAGVQETLMR